MLVLSQLVKCVQHTLQGNFDKLPNAKSMQKDGTLLTFQDPVRYPVPSFP